MVIRSLDGLQPAIDASAYVDESAQVIGDVVLGRDSSVWPHVVIRGDIHKIRVGDRTNIQDGSVLHVTHDSEYQPGGYRLQIGSRVTVGHGVILHGCQVEDLCLIGMGSTVMDGAIVESGVMLGAGSLVTPGKVLTSGYLWMGIPAKQVRELTEKEHEYIEYVSNHYVKLKNRYTSEHNQALK